MAGAVDLSALKQRASPPARRSAQARGSRRAAWRSPRPTSKPRCWSGPTRCRSSCCCGRRAATPACNWATRWPSLAAADAGKWSLANGERRHDAAGRADVRRAGRADGGGAGRGPAVVELPGRAAARAAAPLGRLAARRHRRKARRRRRSDGDEPEQVDPELAQARVASGRRRLRRRAQRLPGDPRRQPQPRRGQGRCASDRASCSARTALPPEAIAAADAAPDDIEAAFAAADVEILQQNVAAAFDRLIALVRAHRRRRAHDGPHAADRAVRPVRPGRSRGHRGPAQPRQRAVLTPSGEQTQSAAKRRDSGARFASAAQKVSRVRLEPQRGQRRQHHHRRCRAAVPRLVGRLDGAEVADARTVVDVGVGVEHLAPGARVRQAEPIAGCARSRRS